MGYGFQQAWQSTGFGNCQPEHTARWEVIAFKDRQELTALTFSFKSKIGKCGHKGGKDIVGNSKQQINLQELARVIAKRRRLYSNKSNPGSYEW